MQSRNWLKSSPLKSSKMLEHPILAIDYGDARIGLACTDMLGIAVHPLATVPRKLGFEKTCQYLREKQIVHIVIGLPLMRDASEGESAKKARAFAKELQVSFPELKVSFQDESFSTVDAASKLHKVGLNAKKQKSVIDQAAAMEILNRFLEQHGEGYSAN